VTARSRSSGSDGPRRVGESLDAVVTRLGPTDASSFGAIFGRWEAIAGPALSAHVQPVRLTDDNTLVLAADHPAWATQVRSLGQSLLTEVARVAGVAPTRIDVVVRHRSGGR
jgi:predicted nucleic acid-binding Zn ribbon protein